jgi:hypothetical protein
MIRICDLHHDYVDGGFYTSPKKNLGNKLSMYIGARLISDLLDINLIVPENAIIRRQSNVDKQWHEQIFPFKSITNRKEIKEPIVQINDGSLRNCSIECLVNNYKNNGFVYRAHFGNYNYIKPYKDLIKEIYKPLTLPQRNDNSLILLLRNSTSVPDYEIKNDDYYLDIINNESFDNIYVSADHIDRHHILINKISKYNPIILDGSVLDIFAQVTSFKKIIASQGTFSFWACFLSNADKIYWPITNYGPNQINNLVMNEDLNLLVDDDDRYENIKIYNKFYKKDI